MNTCSLSGRLTWDPQLRYQANGKPELYIRVAVPNGERDGTQFYLPFDITVYGKDCEPLAELLEAGDLVELTGQNAWPKAPRKPGGKWIPAAICFGVTKIAGPVISEHEHAPGYGHEDDHGSMIVEPVSVPHEDNAPLGRKRPSGPKWTGKKSTLRMP